MIMSARRVLRFIKRSVILQYEHRQTINVNFEWNENTERQIKLRER